MTLFRKGGKQGGGSQSSPKGPAPKLVRFSIRIEQRSELQFLSPALRTYVSENPDADIATLRYMEEQRIKNDLAAQEMRQQLDELITG